MSPFILSQESDKAVPCSISQNRQEVKMFAEHLKLPFFLFLSCTKYFWVVEWRSLRRTLFQYTNDIYQSPFAKIRSTCHIANSQGALTPKVENSPGDSQHLATQSVVPGPGTSASPGNLFLTNFFISNILPQTY